MKYLIGILIITILLLGYKSYENSKQIEELTTVVSEIYDIVNPEPEPLLSIGTVVSDFALLNSEKQTVTLENFPSNTNKVIVFTAKECSYCEDYFPELANFSKNNEDIPLIVIQ